MVNHVDEVALTRFLKSPPKVHSAKDFRPHDSGNLINWGIQTSFLRYMSQVVKPSSLTLETGSGLSTICFAICGSDHMCISPASQEHERVRAYCSQHGISADRIRFVAMNSQEFLPSLDLAGKKLDFALIDGAHAFPIPIIDYFYVNENLKIGGLLAIDDLAIPSVGILHEFLITEPGYRLIKLESGKTGVYQKIVKTTYPNDWLDQNFNELARNSSYLPIRVRLRERLSRFPHLRAAYNVFKKWQFPP